jgi:2'-5' RNA ligase
MITFSQFSKSASKKYTYLTFTPDTVDYLRAYTLVNEIPTDTDYSGSKIDPSEFNYHITVTHSNVATADQLGVYSLSEFAVLPKGFAIYGESTLVLELELDSNLRSIYNNLIRQGHRSDYESYKPHISLTYSKYTSVPVDLSLPRFPIIVNKLTVENQ